MAEMTDGLPDPLYDDNGKARREVYQYLEQASPEQRREAVLLLIEQHSKAEGRLELPRLADGTGACLRDLDRSRQTLVADYRERIEQASAPKWWNAEVEGAYLGAAHLERDDLSATTLTGVYLAGAWLDRTRLRRSQLGDMVGDELAARAKTIAEDVTRGQLYSRVFRF